MTGELILMNATLHENKNEIEWGCCFTGHRPDKFSFGYNENDNRFYALKEVLKEKILQAISVYNVKTFYSGMSLGVDIWCSEIVIELKEQYNLKLIAVLLFKRQAAKWSEEQRRKYKYILKQCDKILCSNENFKNDAYRLRNEYMVTKSDVIIAVYDEKNNKASGTGQTVRMAQCLHKVILLINPTLIY